MRLSSRFSFNSSEHYVSSGQAWVGSAAKIYEGLPWNEGLGNVEHSGHLTNMEDSRTLFPLFVHSVFVLFRVIATVSEYVLMYWYMRACTYAHIVKWSLLPQKCRFHVKCCYWDYDLCLCTIMIFTIFCAFPCPCSWNSV